MVSTLLHQLHPKPPNATHARVSNHLTSPGHLGLTTLAIKRYPLQGLSAGASIKKRPLFTERCARTRFTANLPANVHTQRCHNTLQSKAHIDAPPRLPNAMHNRNWASLGHPRANRRKPNAAHAMFLAYARSRMPGALCPEPYAQSNMPGDICPEAYERSHLPETICPKTSAD